MSNESYKPDPINHEENTERKKLIEKTELSPLTVEEILGARQETSIFEKISEQRNESLVLVSRFKDPVIKSQVVETLHKAYEMLAMSGKENDTVLIDENDEEVQQSVVIPSIEEISRQYDEHVSEIERVTNITFTGREPESNTMDSSWEFPGIGKLSNNQLSIIEAHEKGHFVRNYPGQIQENFFIGYFSKGFDPEAISIDVPVLQQKFGKLKNMDEEKARDIILGKIFSPGELAERMSQMKNYFGMDGSEKFTKQHLQYVRENYVKDTGLDNWMTETLQAITPEKEAGFLELINTAGI